MHVILEMVGRGVVDDEPASRNVQASASNRGRNEDRKGRLHVPEVGDGFVSLLLLLPAMEGKARIARADELLVEAVTLCLSVDKHDDLPPLHPQSEELEEASEFVLLRNHLSVLLNSVTCHTSSADHNLDGVLKTVAGKALDRLWEGGREEANLAIWADGLKDGGDLRLETHVEHPISLVHYDVGNPSKRQNLPSLHGEDVYEPSRCCDNNLGPPFELPYLLGHGTAAVNTAAFQVQVFAKLLGNVSNLQRELSGGGKNEPDRARLSRVKRRLGHDVPQQWEDKG
mmetsp:Transcript_13381/g.27308  ORF Transcript_13381/g.27308 Transcript_13381/m.27308 type:complete len:285 (-) Transcript_13381:1181-2035(-)